MVEQAIGEDETAKMIRPWPDGPIVKAVPDEAVRYRYYARIAEKTAHGEDHQKLADRQRQAFYRAINDALKALILMACDRDGTRFLWLRIPHTDLLKSVARRIVDRRVLHLIKMWLDCPVEETDQRGCAR